MKYMKRLIILLLALNTIYCVGQEILPRPDITQTKADSVTIEEYHIVGERDPEAQFPGGAQGLLKYIQDEFDWDCIKVTDSLIERSKVYLSFVVEVDGSVNSVSVERGINQQLDECCVNFIKKMPKWIPAKNGSGKPVAQRVRLPINICLN
jgi:protein TonB